MKLFQWSVPLLLTSGWLIWLMMASQKNFKLRSNPDGAIQLRLTDKQNFSEQRLVILAGPHKTGTSSIQTNLWKWCNGLTKQHEDKDTHNDDNHNDNDRHKDKDKDTDTDKDTIIPNWVWAVPPQIIDVESSDKHTWSWNPSKGFYPLLEALRNYTIYATSKPTRTLFKKYKQTHIVDMYTEYLRQVWTKGHHIVMGTEAMDTIIKDIDGVRILNTLVHEVLSFTLNTTTPTTTPTTYTTPPSPTTKTRVTIVIVYRTPKVKHLISIWHQNTVQRNSPGFHQWITHTNNQLGPIDALGMVDLVLQNTPHSWNVVLVDSSGVQKEGWDISNLIACEVMNVDCGEGTNGVLGVEPDILNVRQNKKPADVEDDILEQMDEVMRGYDCNYQHLFDGSIYNDRLKVLYPLELSQIMEHCKNRNTSYPTSRNAMKKEIVKIALASRTK